MHAQAAAPLDAKAAAEAHFRAGLARADAGDWRAALAEFDASYALLPSASALSNKALSLQRLGQHAEALALCDQVLKDFMHELEADERTQLERVRADLASHVGEVVLQMNAPEASVFIDGQEYRPRVPNPRFSLNAGEHSIRIMDVGKHPADYRVVVRGGELVSLDVAPQTPAPVQPKEPAAPRSDARPNTISDLLSLEGAASLLWASSFGGSADASCGSTVVFADDSSGPGCSDRSRPFGAAVSVRVAYNWLPNLWLEAGLGYLSLSAHMRRSLEVAGENALFGSRDLDDRVTLSGGLLTMGLSYRVLPKTPIVARVSTGLLLGRQTASVSGAFAQTSNFEATMVRGGGELHLDEDPAFVWSPLVSPELRAGIRVTPRLTVDLGLALLILFVPHQNRTGDAWQQRDERRWPLTRDGANVGIVQLPNESALGAVVAFAPSVGARWDL